MGRTSCLEQLDRFVKPRFLPQKSGELFPLRFREEFNLGEEVLEVARFHRTLQIYLARTSDHRTR